MPRTSQRGLPSPTDSANPRKAALPTAPTSSWVIEKCVAQAGMTSPRRLKHAAVATRAIELATKRRRGRTVRPFAPVEAGAAGASTLGMLILRIIRVQRPLSSAPSPEVVRLDLDSSESDHNCVVPQGLSG